MTTPHEFSPPPPLQQQENDDSRMILTKKMTKFADGEDGGKPQTPYHHCLPPPRVQQVWLVPHPQTSFPRCTKVFTPYSKHHHFLNFAATQNLSTLLGRLKPWLFTLFTSLCLKIPIIYVKEQALMYVCLCVCPRLVSTISHG